MLKSIPLILLAACTAQTPIPFTAMSLNIAQGAGIKYRTPENRQGLHRLVDSVNPDVIALQEVDMFTTRSGYVDTAKEVIGNHYRIVFAKGLDFKEDPYSNQDEGEFGLAVGISNKFQVVSSKVVKLSPDTRDLWIAQVLLLDSGVTVINTHLHCCNADVNRLQRADISRLLLEMPIVLLGDFNFVDTNFSLTRAGGPGIDQIWTNLPFGETQVLSTEFSDHPAIVTKDIDLLH